MTAEQCPLKCKPPAPIYVCTNSSRGPNASYGCVQAAPGTAGAGAKEVCDKNCAPPPPVFSCDRQTLTCSKVPHGHPNATGNLSSCTASCQKSYQCSADANYTC